jgi:hypothetical protein
MFRKRWGGRIESDAGFSAWLGRDALAYREGNRRMEITIDWGGKQIAVFQVSIARWDDDPGNLIDEKERTRIAGNIQRVVESQGYTTKLM